MLVGICISYLTILSTISHILSQLLIFQNSSHEHLVEWNKRKYEKRGYYHTINVYCQHAKYLLFVNRSFTKGSTKKNEYKEISF